MRAIFTLLILPGLLAAAAPTPVPGALVPALLSPTTKPLGSSPTAAAQPTPQATADTRVRQLMDALLWQPDPRRAGLQVEVTQIGLKDADPEVHVTVTDLAPTSLTARVLYDNSFGGETYLGSQAIPPSLREHDLLLALAGGDQERYVALSWNGEKVLEALNTFTKERPETLQGKDAQYLLFNLLDPDTFGTDIYRALPGKEYECVLRCVPFAQRFDALNQYLRQHDAFIDGQSISPCGSDHP